MPDEDLLAHDPTDGTKAVTGEFPPEHLRSFPTRSLMDPMGEVAGYAALAQGAHRREARVRVAVLLALASGVGVGVVVGLVNLVGRLLG